MQIYPNLDRHERDGHGLWAVELAETGEVVGDCGLVWQEVETRREVEIGYHMRRDLWEQGFATEAARAARDHGFDHFGYRRLISLIQPRNVASRRVAQKNGLTIEREILWADLPHLVYHIHRN